MAHSTSSAELAKIASSVRRLKNGGKRRAAIFLGAGASATFEYPLTRDLLPQIIAKLRSRTFLRSLDNNSKRRNKNNRELLRKYLTELMPGKSIQKQNLPLVTSLLSLLDYSVSTGQSILAGRSAIDNRKARQLLERAILEVIDDDTPFTNNSERLHDKFSSFVRTLQIKGQKLPSGIITTNYDMAADPAAFKAAGVSKDEDGYWSSNEIASKIDFGFSWSDTEEIIPKNYSRPDKPLLQVFKLHGSTNWLKCSLCDSVYVNPWGTIWELAYRSFSYPSDQCHCSKTQLEAQIVSPSFVREMREPNLLSVWKNALDTLRMADDWIVIGYSFPDEDLAVRALFTRAYASHRSAPHLTVIQKDMTSFSCYDAFFDSSKISFCTGGLASFLREWNKN